MKGLVLSLMFVFSLQSGFAKEISAHALEKNLRGYFSFGKTYISNTNAMDECSFEIDTSGDYLSVYATNGYDVVEFSFNKEKNYNKADWANNNKSFTFSVGSEDGDEAHGAYTIYDDIEVTFNDDQTYTVNAAQYWEGLDEDLSGYGFDFECTFKR